ncbi:hypothetical protein [Actinokineospora bangkokensis]|uniref:Uncharacterized protein n=1 Tax=Actinokineospora bangkokensis TaxID=1193682 RepID=A0A1Q9LQ69_9PSEU|nr:hypothetical protein [Actinokineospora bangkokensis]OLR94172.1 hypothetical protein BJP25_10230 [Actinokineospora bangkokensis]
MALGAVVGATAAALFYEGVAADPLSELPASRPAAEAVPEPIPATISDGPTIAVVTAVSLVSTPASSAPPTTTTEAVATTTTTTEVAPPPPAPVTTTTTTTARPVPTTTTTKPPPPPPTTTTTTKKPCGLLWC